MSNPWRVRQIRFFEPGTVTNLSIDGEEDHLNNYKSSGTGHSITGIYCTASSLRRLKRNFRFYLGKASIENDASRRLAQADFTRSIRSTKRSHLWKALWKHAISSIVRPASNCSRKGSNNNVALENGESAAVTFALHRCDLWYHLLLETICLYDCNRSTFRKTA